MPVENICPGKLHKEKACFVTDFSISGYDAVKCVLRCNVSGYGTPLSILRSNTTPFVLVHYGVCIHGCISKSILWCC